MTAVDLKGLHRVKVRNKKTGEQVFYFYAWRGGPRIDAKAGTPEFLTKYAELTRKGPAEGKLEALVAAYRDSDTYRGLAESTRHNWAPWFDRIRDGLGNLSIKTFDKPEVRPVITRWRNRWKDTPRTADFGKQVLSAVLSYGVAEGKLGSNPCFGIPNLYSSDRSEIIWKPEDLERFLATCSNEVGWALRLAALTGLRQGDLLRLEWSHVNDLSIDMNTSKSKGKRVAVIPMYGDLKTLLAEIPRRAKTVLTTMRGQPWGSGFSSSWNKSCLAAAFPKEEHERARKEGRLLKLEDSDWDLHFHDARGTAATRFYLAGLTLDEIAEILGWEKDHVERIINRYVRRDALLRARIERLNAAG